MSDQGGAFDVGTVSGTIQFENKFSAVLDAFHTELGKIGSEFKDFGQTVKDGIEDPLGHAKEMASSFLEELGPVGVGITAVGAAAAATAMGLFELSSKAAEAGESVLAFSRITGAAPESIGALSAAATIGGSSLDQLQGMLFQVQKRMDAVGPGADKFDKGLKDLNIDAAAFREADPSERIDMLSRGIHDAAGNANLMSDAIAVMGRGAMANLPLLTKNFADLEAQGKALGYTWSKDDLEASEKFKEATGALNVQLSTLMTTVGVALIPAMTAAAHITSDLFGFFITAPITGMKEAFGLLTGALGETALSEAKFAELQSYTNKLFNEAKAAGIDAAKAQDTVAESLLSMGVAQDKVAQLTGLTTIDVKVLAASMKDAATGSKDYDEALSRVEESYGRMKPSIADVSQEFADWVLQLKDQKNSMEDIAKVTGLTVDQINLLGDAEKKAEDIAAKNIATLQKLSDQIDANAAKKAADAIKDQKNIDDLWNEYNSLLEADGGTAQDKQIAAVDKWYADLVEKYSAAGKDTDEFYAAAGAIATEKLKAISDAAKTTVDNVVEVAHAFQDMNEEVMGITSDFDGWNEAIMSVNKSLDGTVDAEDAVGRAADKAAAAMQKLKDMGNSVTYDLSTSQARAQFSVDNPDVANFLHEGYSLAQAFALELGKQWGYPVNIAEKGPRVPGFKDGGMVDIMVGENGPEAMRVPLGTQVFPNGTGPNSGGGSQVLNFYVNGTAAEAWAKIKTIAMRELKSQRQFGAS